MDESKSERIVRVENQQIEYQIATDRGELDR